MDSFNIQTTSNSFPRTFDYPAGQGDKSNERYVNSMNTTKPKILIMGLRRSGKSSIQKVVFHKMSPNETLFLESTNKIVKDEISNNSFICFSIWDFPGNLEEFEYNLDNVFGGCGALVFVIDSQDDYGEALNYLNQIIRKANRVNKNLNFEVFIHKVDGLSDDHKIEARQEIHQRSSEDLLENGEENILLSFYLTSIYDHSIFEAFSKVVQKLIPQMPILENLLNVYISNSGIEKAFLFDVVSKIFIATDSSPVDMQSYELCCDMIDVVIDISCIYGFSINEQGEPSTFDRRSSASIRLNSGTVLYLREVNKFLALVSILREENFSKQSMIDYNFNCFRQSIQEVFTERLLNKHELYHIHPEDMMQGSRSSLSIHCNDDVGDPNLNEVELGNGSFENESPISMNKRTSTPINSPTTSTLGSSFTQSPHHIPLSNPYRKTAILPTTTIPSSLPNSHTLRPNSVSTKTKLHSPNILSNGPMTHGYFKSSFQ